MQQIYKTVAQTTTIMLVATILTATEVHAQTWERLSLKGIVDVIIGFVGGVLLPILITILFLVFVFGIISYIRAANSGKEDMADQAKKRLFFPIVVIFAIFTLWGTVALIRLLFSA